MVRSNIPMVHHVVHIAAYGVLMTPKTGKEGGREQDQRVEQVNDENRSSHIAHNAGFRIQVA